MPTLTLNAADLRRLPAATVSEILALFDLPDELAASEASHASGWFPVPHAIMKRFMSGVAEQSKELLKLLAEHNGELKWSQMSHISRLKEWQDLKGFQAGMNRRLRGLIDDPEAIFVSWDESRVEYDADGRPVDGYLKVHPETAESLRKYFAIA